MKNIKYHTVRTIQNPIVKSIPLAHIYIYTHCPGFLQALGVFYPYHEFYRELRIYIYNWMILILDCVNGYNDK